MSESRTAVATGPASESALALEGVADDALDAARRHGADAAEVSVAASRGLSVTVRLGDVETVEHNRDKRLVLGVYFGHRKGSASTTDFSAAAIADTARAACAIARHTAEDPYNGLADVERLATSFPDLDLCHPWDVQPDDAIALATACEDAGRAADARIVNSEGATVSTRRGRDLYANTNGFRGGVRATRHAVSCAVVGAAAGEMQRDYWYTAARDARDLEAPEQVGRTAARRAARRLEARRLSTRRAPVLYEAPVAASLVGHLVAAVSGPSLYRGASFLRGHRDRRVFAEQVRIHEQPHLPKAMGSAAFDHEGVATADRDLVTDGILQGYVLDSYAARKLGLETTGNAGGVHNLTLDAGSMSFEGLLKAMDTGLLVTELIGFGVNIVTGDYSRGAAGFWVQGGEIQFPVQEITVAGKLPEMFLGLREVGTDVDYRRNIRTGSILIENMTIAGE